MIRPFVKVVNISTNGFASDAVHPGRIPRVCTRVVDYSSRRRRSSAPTPARGTLPRLECTVGSLTDMLNSPRPCTSCNSTHAFSRERSPGAFTTPPNRFGRNHQPRRPAFSVGSRVYAHSHAHRQLDVVLIADLARVFSHLDP